MYASLAAVFSTARRAWSAVLAAPLLALPGCSGTAVVTMTSTASPDNFPAYRVGLVSVAAPFSGYSSSAIDVDIHNQSIGVRHQIQVGAQTVNVLGLAADALIVPNAASSNAVFTIGHAASSTSENFDTFAAFVARVQA
jgi:hypothetical protein